MKKVFTMICCLILSLSIILEIGYVSLSNAITENKRFMGINAYQAGHIEISVIDSKFCYGGVEGGGSTDKCGDPHPEYGTSTAC